MMLVRFLAKQFWVTEFDFPSPLLRFVRIVVVVYGMLMLFEWLQFWVAEAIVSMLLLFGFLFNHPSPAAFGSSLSQIFIPSPGS